MVSRLSKLLLIAAVTAAPISAIAVQNLPAASSGSPTYGAADPSPSPPVVGTGGTITLVGGDVSLGSTPTGGSGSTPTGGTGGTYTGGSGGTISISSPGGISVASDIVVKDFGSGLIVTSVPEPETYTMLLAGLGMLGLLANRRKK